jgi:hypothetical protein
MTLLASHSILGEDMKRIVFPALGLTAALLLVAGLTLVGCQDLSSSGDSGTTAVQSTSSDSTSAPVPTTAQSTDTTKSSGKTATTAPSYTFETMPQFDVVTRYEESDPHLDWIGQWSFGPNDKYSGSDCGWTSTVNAQVTITFSGTYISLVCMRGHAEGLARLILDGGAVDTTLDYYRATDDTTPQQVWESGTLTDGVHTLVVRCLGTQNPSAKGAWIGLDAFDVVGTIQ